MECLKAIAKDADETCRTKCSVKGKEIDGEENQVKKQCRTVECRTICYFNEFSENCPDAHDMLLRLNLRTVDDIRMVTDPRILEQMHETCRNLNEKDYMREKLLGTKRIKHNE
ncbi:hypothetical protein AB6A40_007245 [Gnathostoma spinigerum]|uniref:Uncharacterized protein n=1 Tax=Gnathostoma spinigerum TaxID=75299 RepID=A0ABD6EMN1_9BILA